MPDIYLYAELLIHIRRLTLYGCLAEGKKIGGPGGTKLLLAPNKKIITAVHKGESARIYLPSKISGTAGVTFPMGKGTEFSARLTLGDTNELEKVVDGREEGIEAPWSATDLDDGCEEWKNLPSEHWADLMDLWFCHKPHEDGEDEAGENKGFGAKSQLRVSEGTGLVNVLSLLLHQEDCSSIKVSSLGAAAIDINIGKPISIGSSSISRSTQDLLLCEKCSTFLGTLSGDISQNSCRLFKSALSVQRQSYDLSVFIGAQLLHLIQNSISRRVIIHTATTAATSAQSAEGILAWVFIPDIYYASSQSPSNPFFIRAMKVLYKVIDNPLELLDSPTSTVEELPLPAIAYSEFKSSFESSAKILPHSARTFKMGSDEWNVGLVERWEKTPSGRRMLDGNLPQVDMNEGAEGGSGLSHRNSAHDRIIDSRCDESETAVVDLIRGQWVQPHELTAWKSYSTTTPPASIYSVRSIRVRPAHPSAESTQTIQSVAAADSSHACIQSPAGPDRAPIAIAIITVLLALAAAERFGNSLPLPPAPSLAAPKKLHRASAVRAAAVEAYRRFGHKQLDPDCLSVARAQQPNNCLPVCRYPTAYIMSNSPPAEKDVEQSAQSGEEQDQMDREQEGAQGSGADFEVKEQDRWLPIANGTREAAFTMSSAASSPSAPSASSPSGPATRTAARALAASDANIRNFAPVARIMKLALPDNAKIAKEAKECMQECVSEFISFITSEASEKCQQEKRKTVNGEDILFAMTSLGFENYAEALKIYLSKYRETQSTRGENQGRPTSSGGYQAGAPGSNSAAAAGAGTYPTGQSENANSLLSPSHGLDGSDHDTAASYGYPAAVPAMSGDF
ncbi:hypothetical protein DV736_g1976, partial [Chaetothyriales sp. CBS 134916]